MIFPIPGGKKIGSHYLPRYTRYRVIAGRVIKGGHCIGIKWEALKRLLNLEVVFGEGSRLVQSTLALSG